MNRSSLRKLERLARGIKCPKCGRSKTAAPAHDVNVNLSAADRAKVERVARGNCSRCERCGEWSFDFSGVSDADLDSALAILQPAVLPDMASTCWGTEA